MQIDLVSVPKYGFIKLGNVTSTFVRARRSAGGVNTVACNVLRTASKTISLFGHLLTAARFCFQEPLYSLGDSLKKDAR